MAGEQGFEPRLIESESIVLPLHYSPEYCRKIIPFSIKQVQSYCISNKFNINIKFFQEGATEVPGGFVPM